MTPAQRFFGVRVFPWIILAVGALCIWIGVDQTVKAYQSLEWPEAPGEILTSGVRSESSGSRSSTTYHAAVGYRYEVDGRWLEGERISYGEYGTGDYDRAVSIAAQYPVGARVTVYFRPEDVSECVLEPGGQGVPWFFLGMGSMFALAGGLMAKFFPRMFPKQSG